MRCGKAKTKENMDYNEVCSKHCVVTRAKLRK